jgi:hypothetical protein
MNPLILHDIDNPHVDSVRKFIESMGFNPFTINMASFEMLKSSVAQRIIHSYMLDTKLAFSHLINCGYYLPADLLIQIDKPKLWYHLSEPVFGYDEACITFDQAKLWLENSMRRNCGY